jgi:DNA polymerase-3 subunit gamma/tau
VSQIISQTAPHQAIYRRWRAQTFAEIVGQEAVVETLRNAVRTGRVAHAVLFVGPRGTGKTSLARILAKALNCTNLQDGDPCDTCLSCVAIREGRTMDLVEIDAASNRGIDAIRELRERINYAPTELRRKVYILDEAHQITKDAWNALLKSLEEPPDFVAFMFASTQPQDFPAAILSRLQRFDVRRLTTTEIEGKLRRILEGDGREATPEAVHLIARLAAGGMRDAESMLDQLLSSSVERLDEAQVRDLLGLADSETVARFVDALVNGDVLAGVQLLDGIEERGRDLRGLLDQVVEAIRAAMVGLAIHPSVAAHPLTSLVAVARRLAAIDPTRAGVGGLRLQLELALFPDPALAGSLAAASVDGAAGQSAHSRARTQQSETTPPAETAPPAEAPSGTEPLEATEPAAPPASRAPVARPKAAATADADEPAAKPKAAVTADAGELDAKANAAATPEADEGVPSAAPPRPAPAMQGSASTSDGSLSTPTASADLAILRDRWADVVARVGANPSVRPLIAECRPISVEDGVVTLGFPENKAFLKDLLERRRPILEEGIGTVLSRAVAVRCVATNLDLVPQLPSDEEAAFVLAEARRIFADDDADAAEIG